MIVHPYWRPAVPCLRWTPQRRAWVCDALDRGEMTIAEAEEKWGVTVFELIEWRRRYAQGGLLALRNYRVSKADREATTA